MTAKELLEMNGDFSRSPLTDSLRRIHRLFEENSVSYAIIGGLAVVRSGAARTTDDIDVLTSREGWATIQEADPAGFDTRADYAVDRANDVNVDIVFSGTEWEMVIPLGEAEALREYDDEFGCWFIDLCHLIELKTAVFLKKKLDDGIEIAAKDLSDVVALIEKNLELVTDEFLSGMHPEIQPEVKRIRSKVKTSGSRRER